MVSRKPHLYIYGYLNTPFTPWQLNGSHPNQDYVQIPAKPPPFLLPHSIPPVNVFVRLDKKIDRFMQEVNEKISRLDILKEISNRIVSN